MKIYVAGPMTGIKDCNVHEFNSATRRLEQFGLTVFNPAILPECPKVTKEQYMDIDLAMVRSCDAIFMLEGWENSKGAFLEHAYADYLGLKIYYQDRNGIRRLEVAA